MFQNLLKLMVPLSKYNVLKIKVIFWYFKQEYVHRRIAPAMYQSVKEELEKMIKAKVIVPSSSPWCSPVTIAVKKNGTPRICVDFRSLNARTKKDAKSIPRISDMLDALNGKTLFSSLDMMSGFWQIKMTQRAQEMTAFTAGPLGFYEFLRMPFGLCNSGATLRSSETSTPQDRTCVH